MQEFDYQLRPRIIFGSGVVAKLGQLAQGLGCARAFVVSDPGVVRAGLFGAGEKSLKDAEIQVHGFHDLSENPTNLHVERGVLAARAFEPDLLIGLGGGSSMDCAKGINFVYSCGGKIHDYWGVGKATKTMLPMIAVPTTSGTGSETQSFALISDAESHVKMACGDARAACRIALLDPALTVTQPASVTALTGIDAITHALETFVCNKRTPMSECYSREAWQLLSQGFPQVIESPGDVDARGRMQLGACFAGMAIEASMLGAAHSLANPLTAMLGVTHGQAVGLMMPHVVRFNAHIVEDRYRELAKLLPDNHLASSNAIGSERIASVFTMWLLKAGMATTLDSLARWPADLNGDVKRTRELLLELSLSASKQWTASFNPRTVTESDFLAIYQAALA
jgi:alcohol dehydrogenase